MPAGRRIVTVLLTMLAAAAAGPVAQSPDGARWAWSGAVTSRSAVVKVRVDAGGVPVEASVARADARGPIGPMIEAVSDANGVAAFEFAGLEPAAAYRYRVRRPGGIPLEGEFRTFGEGPWSFRLAFSACADTGSTSEVFDAIRTTRPDLFIHTGDIHYEDITRDEPARFRRAFDDVMRSPTQSRLYRAVPIAYTWDDHDFGGNGSDGTSRAKPAALAVYRQAVPHYPLQDDGRGGIHQAFSVGRVRVIMTDSRSQRTPGRGAPSERSMLGQAQLAWLRDELSRAADAPLIVWVNTVPWIARPGSGSDNWGAYGREREEIANHIARFGLAGKLLMLSGDAHMVAIDDGTHSNYATLGGRGARGFVVMHAAPLDRKTSVKGGPYSHGVSERRGQFGLVDVIDDGARLTVELGGRDRAGSPIPGMRLALSCDGETCAVAR